MKEKIEKCDDEQCPIHGKLAARGRVFAGNVIRKFPKRIAIEFERTLFIKKYERYMKKKTRLHARVSKCMENVEVGDYVQVRECRPLSKIIHFVLVEVLRKKSQNKEEEK
ncbi:30S ribosomal protein S17 [Candidatus Pacearchaeota archaeon]|nr:30S ribosomal protein S17 [Candidatus Pacearchaeota archaeon]